VRGADGCARRLRNGHAVGDIICGRDCGQRTYRRGSRLRHDGGGPYPVVSKQSSAQCPAQCNPCGRRERAYGARGLPPPREWDGEPDRKLPGHDEQKSASGNHDNVTAHPPCQLSALHPQLRRYCCQHCRSDRHPDAAQWFSDRKSHASGRGPGLRLPRDAAHNRADGPAQRRHGLYEPSADRSPARAATQQRKRARSDVAADTRPPNRTTSPRRRSISK
jgi:hypothetical protein